MVLSCGEDDGEEKIRSEGEEYFYPSSTFVVSKRGSRLLMSKHHHGARKDVVAVDMYTRPHLNPQFTYF
jgi:hypothetical protein